jgi:hypothetical protein
MLHKGHGIKVLERWRLMKSKNMLLVALTVLVLGPWCDAAEMSISFDGVSNTGSSTLFIRGSVGSDNLPEVPFPAQTTSGATIAEERNLDAAVRHAVNSCSTGGKKSFVCDGLKKLASYGTNAEKLEFMRNSDFILPKRLESLRKPEFLFENRFNKGMWAEVCERKNCRWEEVCGYKERCEVVTSVLCGASLAALLPSGGWVINAISGGAASYACYLVGENVCENVKECQNVEKCDVECHNEYQENPGVNTGVTTPGGQTVWQ